MFKEYIKPIIVITSICLVMSAALALVNSMTAPVIAEAAEERAWEAMRGILPEADGFEAIETDFGENPGSTVKEAYRSTNDAGYVFIAASYGYGGDITVLCAIGTDGKLIGVQTLSHTETVGIGTVIEDESFTAQFCGADSGLDGVDTVTGATVSTKAFIRAVDGVFEAYNIITGGN